MIKKLLPTMIGAVLVGGMTAATADVTVFGHLDTSVDYLDVDPGGGSSSEDDTNLHCNTCSIGFKGSEDLGNGLKAIFKIDFQFNMTERNRDRSDGGSGSQDDTIGTEPVADAITDRDQWLGLAGGFGQVRIGTISTVYKSHGAMIDPLYRTGLQGRDRGLQTNYFHSGAGEESQGRATNTFRYDSPDFNGFKLGATYTLDNNKIADGEDNNPYGIGASYSNGGILAFADYITNDSNDTTTDDKEAWKVGGKYSGGMFGVMGQYEDYQNTGSDEESAWHLGATASLLGIDMYFGYGKMEDDTTNDDLTSWTLAVSHNFSKRTMVYAGHNQYDCDTGGVDATLSICSLVGASGGEFDKTSIGMKHKF